jgi:hypothetical protein
VAFLIIPGPVRRDLPIRRLSREECDKLGYAPPLVLAVRQASWAIGPWLTLKTYRVSQHPNGVVWQGTKEQLADYGIVDLEPP